MQSICACLCFRFVYPIHVKWYPGDTLRYHCTYDSSERSTWTHHGLGALDEMCILYMGYVHKVDGCKLVYSQPVVGRDALLEPCYCGSYTKLEKENWRKFKEGYDTITFQDELQIRSSNEHLRVQDDVPRFCQLLLNDESEIIPPNLIWRFDIPTITLYPGIIIGFIMLILLKIMEYCIFCMAPGRSAEFALSMQDQRKVTIYMASILFYSVILAILLWEMCWDATETLVDNECDFVWNQFDEKDSVQFAYGIPTAANLSVIFLFIELLYRPTVCPNRSTKTLLEFPLKMKVLLKNVKIFFTDS